MANNIRMITERTETGTNLGAEATPTKRDLIRGPLDIQIEKVRVEAQMTIENLTGILEEMTDMDQIEGTQEGTQEGETEVPHQGNPRMRMIVKMEVKIPPITHQGKVKQKGIAMRRKCTRYIYKNIGRSQDAL